MKLIHVPRVSARRWLGILLLAFAWRTHRIAAAAPDADRRLPAFVGLLLLWRSAPASVPMGTENGRRG